MPKISIISPVYNVSKYLPRFLSCLESQTFQDYEVLFVYDESNDNSLEIIKSFSCKASISGRCKIIVNERKKGVGLAKDIAFQASDPSSDYVIFLDSDDYFEETFLEKLLKKAEETNADITCCGYLRINEKTNAVICEEMLNNPTDPIQLSHLSFPLYLINTAAWNKLYRRTSIIEARFGSSTHAEDLYFLLSALRNASTIAFVNEPLYKYYIHSGSLINTLSEDRFKDTFQQFLYFAQYQNDSEYFNLISAFVFLRLGIGTTLRVCQNEYKKRKELIKYAKQYIKTNFNVFGKNQYLSFNFLKRAGKKGIAIWMLKFFYKIDLFSLPATFYIKRMKKSKKEIRW